MRSSARFIVLGLAMLGFVSPGHSQGTFQNLDFEQARIVPLGYPPEVSAADALPGWTVSYDDYIADRIPHDTISIGAAAVSIHDRDSDWKPLEGNYSVMLQGEFLGRTTAYISQTGAIPPDTRTLFFLTESPGPVPWISATFAGEEIAAVRVDSEDLEYPYLWGADISEFAGQTGELKFWGGGRLDSISFSPSVIPEPGTAALVLLGGIAWLSHRRWMRR